MTATTALTAQNTQGVFDIHHTPPQFVARQINLCIDDLGVDVVKTGIWLLGPLDHDNLDETNSSRYVGFC